MDEFIEELMDLCKKHGVKHDDLLPLETDYVETEEMAVTSTVSTVFSETATPPKTYARYMIKIHTLKPAFKKLEKKRL